MDQQMVDGKWMDRLIYWKYIRWKDGWINGSTD